MYIFLFILVYLLGCVSSVSIFINFYYSTFEKITKNAIVLWFTLACLSSLLGTIIMIAILIRKNYNRFDFANAKTYASNYIINFIEDNKG